MRWKSVWKKVKFVWLLIYIIAVTLFVGGLGFVTWLTMVDGKSVDNSHMVNYLSLAIGLTSLPGAFVQLVGMVELNKKKEFISTQECPRCRHKIDVRLREAD